MLFIVIIVDRNILDETELLLCIIKLTIHEIHVLPVIYGSIDDALNLKLTSKVKEAGILQLCTYLTNPNNFKYKCYLKRDSL